MIFIKCIKGVSMNKMSTRKITLQCLY